MRLSRILYKYPLNNTPFFYIIIAVYIQKHKSEVEKHVNKKVSQIVFDPNGVPATHFHDNSSIYTLLQ